MLRVFWAQSSSRISATKPILVASEWNINVWMALQTLVNTFEHTLFWFLSSSPPPLIKRKAHISTTPPPSSFQPVHFLSCELHRPAREHNTNIFSLFLSSNMERPLCLTSHNISCYLPSPHSLLALNDTVYTHPASIIPFHTSPGLFICLGCWGDMKAHSLLLRSRSHLPPLCLPSLSSPPATSAGCLWPLIYEGLLNPGGPVWSTLGEFGWCRGSVVKRHKSFTPVLVVLFSRVWWRSCSRRHLHPTAQSLAFLPFAPGSCCVINVCR